MINYQLLKQVMQSKGYVWFNGQYDLNIIGIRDSDNIKDDYNDTLCVAYKDVNNNERLFIMPCTTDPGHYYLQKPMVSKGTAILKEGQHRSSHRLGTHKGYQALTQRIPLPVYRDNTKDKELDFINV